MISSHHSTIYSTNESLYPILERAATTGVGAGNWVLQARICGRILGLGLLLKRER